LDLLQFAIGVVIGLVLAIRLRPNVLILLGAVTAIAFLITFAKSVNYEGCAPCPTRAESLFWANTILITLAPTLLLGGTLKQLWWIKRHRQGQSVSN
jgi:hypothetical protein